MDMNQIPPEVIQCIGDSLRRAPLNAFIQTSKRHATILTPLLYQKAFRRHFRLPSDDESGPGPGPGPGSGGRSIWVYSRGRCYVSQRRLWACAPLWESEYVMDYFMHRSLKWASTRFGGKERNGATWLHLLAGIGHKKLLLMFIKKGLDLRSRDWDGNTVLHSAAAKGQTEIVDWLIQNGLDVLDLNQLNQSVLIYALTRNQLHREAFIRIIDAVKTRGGNLDVNLDSSRIPPIFLASRMIDAQPIIKHLIDNGAGVFRVSGGATRDTLLHWVARFGHEDIGNFLVSQMKSHPGFISRLNAQRQSPLHIAIQRKRASLSRTLIAAGADIELKDGMGRTSLVMAVYFRCLPILEVLLKKTSPSYYLEAVTLIQEYLWRSIECGDATAVHYLVELQSTCKIQLSLPTLHDLIETHRSRNFGCEIIEIIGDAGANFHLLSRPLFETPLHSVIRRSAQITPCTERIIPYLLIKTNNLSFINREGNSVLHHAARYGSLKTVELTLKHPGMTAEIFALQNNAGNTALHEAVKRNGNHKHIIRLLMKARGEFQQRSMKEKISARSPRKIGKPAVPDPPVRGERKEGSEGLREKSTNKRRLNGNGSMGMGGSLSKIGDSRIPLLRRENAQDDVSLF
ncbi:hypothetical protein DSL72_009044 [Monilinia vaccinii-corymbosi]|uniref:F-box domain-containing protein n=1 Tax=Monilinia vaccinii-corymbosi TaxID=61207 RepID=A0A8A3PPL1_9HELO|nr:hypothetical protein DSL72_009044 [Monilinia vaccinii-corymbosi]